MKETNPEATLIDSRGEFIHCHHPAGIPAIRLPRRHETIPRLSVRPQVSFREWAIQADSFLTAQPLTARTKRIHAISTPTRPMVTVYMNMASRPRFSMPATVSLLCSGCQPLFADVSTGVRRSNLHST